MMVHGQTKKEHATHFTAVLERSEKAGVMLNTAVSDNPDYNFQDTVSVPRYLCTPQGRLQHYAQCLHQPTAVS